MNTGVLERHENGYLSVLKYIFALLIAVSHCLPICSDITFNLYFGQWFFRPCVPLFFISTGYYFHKASENKRCSYIRRIAMMYVICNIIYLPITYDRAQDLASFLRGVILGDRTHLWYLSALLAALAVMYFLEKLPRNGALFSVLAPALFAVGIYFDEYCRVFPNEFLAYVGEKLEAVGGARHALFFALPLLMVGGLISRYDGAFRVPWQISITVAAASFAVSFMECTFLASRLAGNMTCDVTLFSSLTAAALFVFTLGASSDIPSRESSVSLRKQADMIYFSHFWVVELYNRTMGYDYRYRTVTVILAACIIAFVSVRVFGMFTKRRR